MKKTNSYTKLQAVISCVTLNEETYISLRHTDLRNCKNIGYEFYYGDFLVARHKYKYSCKVQYILRFDIVNKIYKLIISLMIQM